MNFKFTIAASLVMTFVGVLSVAGCGGDACTKSSDQLTSCGIMAAPNSTSTSSVAPACIGSTLCLANCINIATCPQLKDATGGMPSATSKPYNDCTAACLTAK